ncbi:hypothetical protein JKP88DRAFT_349555 [Tribonema minus]|uniref:Protein ENHANCED DISEASE RESISTANCE 2 C-terminal domain-containing protein n=1 Tax=Tribonema minus TaxID=303371 RepID=A0A835YTM0_9STRA|nr:hypothetical protein JKP88DRAFT_349555 [Tribonema minus]
MQLQAPRSHAWLAEAEGLPVPPTAADFAWVGRLYKRRSGFGKMAAHNWRLRCFGLTRKGTFFYYEEDDFDKVNFANPPRGSLQLVDGDCTFASGRTDSDAHTPYALVVEERRGGHQRWKLCAQSEQDLAALQQAMTKVVEGGGASPPESPLPATKGVPKLARAQSIKGPGAFPLSPVQDSPRCNGGSSCNGGGGGSPGKSAAPPRSPAAGAARGAAGRASDKRLRAHGGHHASHHRAAGKGGDRGDGGGGSNGVNTASSSAADPRAIHALALYAQLVNDVLVFLHYWPVELWHPLFFALVAVVNVAIAFGAPRVPPDDDSACIYGAVPLVHVHDLPPLVNHIKVMQLARRARDASAGGGVPPAGATVKRAVGYAAGDAAAPAHTWQDGDVSQFVVRGPKYMTDRVKTPSAPALYTMVGCDFYCTPARVSNVSDAHVSVQEISAQAPVPHLPEIPRVIVVNAQMPNQPPDMFSNSDDGPGLQAIFYFAITQQTVDALRDLDKAPSAVKLWARYCAKHGEDEETRGRFKAMCVVGNWADAGLNANLKGWNGKPVLITKTGETFAGKPAAGGGMTCLEMDINVHRFRFPAKKALHTLMERFEKMILHVGFTIEGRTPDELPEGMLACACLNYPCPDEAEELAARLDA